MEKRTRRFLYYLLVAIFAVALPLLLSYALGYEFNLKARTINETGGVFVKSSTPRVSIYLDSLPIKETGLFSGSALLTDVSTDTHILRIEREGYRPWTKTADIESFTVLELRNIILLPDEIAMATTTKDLVPRSGDPAANPSVTVNAQGDLARSDSATTTVLAENIHSFRAFDDSIYFINKNGFLGRVLLASGAVETLGRPGFYLTSTPAQFFSSPQGGVAIIDSGGGLFYTDPEHPVAPVDGGVRTVRFDPRGTKLLIQKEQELMVLWLSENRLQPFQKKFTKESIIRTPTPIINSDWFYPDAMHAILQTNEGIFLTELDGRGGRNTFEIILGAVADFAVSPDEPNRVYIKQGTTWYSIEL